MKFKEGKKALVVGAAESGLWAAELLGRNGFGVSCSSHSAMEPAAKRRFKRLCIPFEENGHTEAFLAGGDFFVASPGVKPSSAPLRFAASRRIPILSEFEAASRFITGPWIAVTGTNGKTTTATLLARIVSGWKPCDLCGNVGKALSRSVIENPRQRRVDETSSFQLHYVSDAKPTVAVILNLKPNHLDWHPTLGEYYSDKLRLIARFGARDTAVVNADDAELMRRVRRSKANIVRFSLKPLKSGYYKEDAWIVRARSGRAERWISFEKARLKGEHNFQNMLAAAAAADAFGVPKAAIQKGIDAFRPLKHRIEPVGSVRGVAFINDSKSTTVESTRAALESVEGRVVLIAGGRAKEKDFSSIGGVLRRKASAAVFYGEAAGLIASQIGGFDRKRVVNSFREAVTAAYASAKAGEAVLLSPMCASFDQFSSYEERGEAFRKIFLEIKESRG
jgi:UDP-N-acetylmuramoylalanine--D-glutamate ligase